MIEILFTESAAGSMKLAKGIKNIVGSSTAVLILNDDGSEPTAEELERERAKVEEEYRRKRENAISVEGTARDVACFPLNLSMGDISEPFSDNRTKYLQSTVLIGGPNFAEIGAELMAMARRSLERVQATAEPVRVWTSRNPDEACGFCHILTYLPADADIRVVELPEMEVLDGELRAYTGWGEISPYELGRFQELERPLTDDERRSCTDLWRELQRENGPLRAVVAGKLRTVGADHYDWIIERELPRQKDEFHEGRLIGEILGKYPFGLTDSLLALRMEEFISWGKLIPISEPMEDRPIYHRYLRRVKTKLESDDWRLLSVDVDELMYRDINPTDGEELGLHARHLTHCAFCWTQVEHTRHQYWYLPTDLPCCICENCFRDFRELFHWNELDGWDMEWEDEQ